MLIRLFLVLCIATVAVGGCTKKKTPDLKSPCVSADIPGTQNPCGPRRHINEDWQLPS